MTEQPPPLTTAAQAEKDRSEKEAKAKRAANARQKRAEERKAKRHMKAQAKRERKLNVKRSAKWTDERRQAEMKAKKIANKPIKTEKKRLRLLTRKKKLEIQAHKLLAEAKKAGEVYEALTRLKEAKEAEEKAANAKTYDLVIDDSSDSVSNASGSDHDDDALVAGVPADEVVLKQRRESDAASVRSGASLIKTKAKEDNKPAQDAKAAPLPEAAQAESKKRGKKSKANKVQSGEAEEKDAQGDVVMGEAQPEPIPTMAKATMEPTEEETKPSAKNPKGSKGKRKRDDDPEEAITAEEPVAKEKDKKEKGEKKDKAEKDEALENEDKESGETGESPARKDKKEKKGKKDKRDKKDKTKDKGQADDAANGAAEAEKWNVGELAGGSARQDKFLRLLGGKKQGGGAAKGTAGHKSKAPSSARAETDIQRQFEEGMKMKAEGNGHRRGLGA